MKIPVGALTWLLIYWGGPLQFIKLEGVVQSTRRVSQPTACVGICSVQVSWNTNLAGRTLLRSPPFELGLSSFTSLQEAGKESKAPVVRGNSLK